MPKIIENAREVLIEEAKKQILERGYKATTIRSVAAGCGIAVGTVYNYFASKEMLVASLLLEEWTKTVSIIKSKPCDVAHDYLFTLYSELVSFARKHSAIFTDKDAMTVYNSVSNERHKILRAQLTELILPIVHSGSTFEAEFVAEAMLTWTMAGREFEEIYNVIKKIII